MAAHHGAPRYTGDLDLFVRPTQANAARVLTALKAFGFGSLALTEADFTSPGMVVQLGFAPWRIDLLTSIEGVDWDEAIRSSEPVDWLCGARAIGREALIANKRAVGRPRDLDDIARLGGA